MSLKLDTTIITNANIDPGNAALCIEAGAAGCAVITAVIGAPNVKEATARLALAIRDAKTGLRT